MSDWVTVPCLLELRQEFNLVNPRRDKGADGTIGDTAHTSSSDHTPDEDSRVLRDHDADNKNEVHALDIDSTGPWPSTTFDALVMKVIEGERKKWLDPKDKCRLNYVIWNRKIYDKDNDFQPQTYKGSDPHTNHAHFSSRYETSCENDTRPWGVKPEVIKVATQFNDEDKAVLQAEATDGMKTLTTLVGFETGGGQGSVVGNSVWGHGFPRRQGDTRTSAYSNIQAIQQDLDALRGALQQVPTAEDLGRVEDKLDQVLAFLNQVIPPPAVPSGQ